MDNLNEIFSRATQSDLDTELAAAGELLQKVAEAEGIDLSQLSDDDVAELMVDLMPSKIAEEPEKGEDKKASIPEGLTFADVAVELSKAAAAEGVDLTQLSREDYHAAFDAVATRMASPEFASEKQAAEEAQAKLAEADALGRVMARAFMDEQAKIAEAGDGKTVKEMAAQTGKTKQLFGHPETAKEKVEGVGRKIKEKAQELGGKAMAKGRGVDEAVQGVGAKLLAKARLGGKGISANAARAAGYGTGAAGLAAAGGLAYGAKKLMEGDKGKRKRSLDEAALEMARNTLLENGIDPDSGEKIAEIEAKAAEILKEAGWID